MALPLASSASLPDYHWIGPEHTVPELHAAKRHLDNGGIVYVCRSAGELAALIGRGSHGRTEKAGTLLNVSTHASVDQSNPLAQEIDLNGACFYQPYRYPT